MSFILQKKVNEFHLERNPKPRLFIFNKYGTNFAIFFIGSIKTVLIFFKRVLGEIMLIL